MKTEYLKIDVRAECNVQSYLPCKNVIMWCPKMGCHIQVKRENESRIYDLAAINELSNKRINCMRKRYYNYDLEE